MSYSDLLRDPRWQKKRLKIFERDGWKCRGCGAKDVMLCAHHVKYARVPWDVDDKYIVTQCDNCHKMLGEHKKGGIWFDMDSMGTTLIMIHCPICGCDIFKDKGSSMKCMDCGLRFGVGDFHDGGITFSEMRYVGEDLSLTEANDIIDQKHLNER